MAASLGASLALLSSPVANAWDGTEESPSPTSSQDQEFFTALRTLGIVPGPNALAGAEAICKVARGGMSIYEVAREVHLSNPQLKRAGSHGFVGAAVSVYCPEVSPVRTVSDVG